MKKILVTLSLLLMIATSMVAGTLALYSASVDNAAESTVVAKTFVFTAEASESFATEVKMAPGETLTFDVEVKNNDGSNYSEVDMDVAFVVSFTGDLAAADIDVTTPSALVLTGGANDSEVVTVTVSWAAGNAGDDNQFIGKSGLLQISASAVQKLAA